VSAAKIRVLLIDDDEDQAVITRDLLEEAEGLEFELDWLPTYEQGLEQLLAGDHDVCFLDYRLGARTGLDLLRAAMQADCAVPVVMLTGQGDHEVDMAAMEAGAADFLAKAEISPSQLARSLRYARARRVAAEDRVRKEKLQGVLEMAGAACHEFSQPLQALMGYVELVARGAGQGSDDCAELLGKIHAEARRLAEVVNKVNRITSYETRDYAGNVKIVDIDKAASSE